MCLRLSIPLHQLLLGYPCPFGRGKRGPFPVVVLEVIGLLALVPPRFRLSFRLSPVDASF